VARAVGASVCKWCGAAPALLPGTGAFATLAVCLVCDTAPATNPGNRLYAGPPNLPDSKNGWFLPT
jgi:hypothetical protein